MAWLAASVLAVIVAAAPASGWQSAASASGQPPTPPQGAAAAPPAQAPRPATQENGLDGSKQWKMEQVEKGHWRLTGAVAGVHGDARFFADVIDSYPEEHRLVATGNVVFEQGGNHIAADKAEFNTETRLGTFINANGTTVLAEKPTRDAMGSQDPDVYFYGEKIEKIGPKKFKITNGGFTTCVQPTPRWQVTATTVIMNLDHYAYLHGAVLKAKGVPLFYVPVMIYPINKEGRSTGFLMPSYGTSTIGGFTLSNAFFWAISRSQDLTVMHDWYTKRGQGVTAEYRYIQAPGSQGNFSVNRLVEHEATYTDSGGNSTVQPAQKSLTVRGDFSQQVARGWFARGRVNYFSSLTTQQNYQRDIYNATNTNRSVNAAISGAVKGVTVNASFDRSEYFYSETSSTVTGAAPRIQLSLGERPLFGSPLYLGVNGEYAKLLRQQKTDTTDLDSGLSRADISPSLRLPFTKLRWLTVNTSATWHGTYWTRSKETTADNSPLIDEGISRSYFEFQSRIVGPSFNKVWNTPGNGYAEKFKHTIEPSLTVSRQTAVDNFKRIIQLDSGDYVLGGTTSYAYGVTNRFMAKRKGGPRAGTAQEFLNISLSQTYYSNSQASQYDLNYSTSYSGGKPSNFSPISLRVRLSPTDQVDAGVQVEYDAKVGVVKSVSSSARLALRDWVNVTGTYSQRRVEESLSGTTIAGSVLRPNSASDALLLAGLRQFNSDYAPAYHDSSISATTNVRLPGNKLGGYYTFNYDIHQGNMLNSRFMAYYNAQCCGFTVEYQTYNLNWGVIKQDNRFNFSFTLAGLGTFSNFFGALGGASQR